MALIDVHLARFDPANTKAMIVGAFRKAGCCMADAAEDLGVHPSTLRRIVAVLGIGDRLRAMEKKARGTKRHHGRVGGWPLGRPRK